jgi:hypothetical protein
MIVVVVVVERVAERGVKRERVSDSRFGIKKGHEGRPDP